MESIENIKHSIKKNLIDKDEESNNNLLNEFP